MELRKSPRKAVASRKSRESVVEIDGEELVVATEKKKVARRKKVVKVEEEEEEEEEEDVKPLVGKSKKRLLEKLDAEEEEEEEEKLPVSRKKGKVSVQENDHLDAERLSDGFEARGGAEEEKDVELVKEEEEDGGLAVSQDDDMLLTQLSGFQTQDTEEGDVLETQEQERRIRPRVRAVFVTFMFYECFLYLICSILSCLGYIGYSSG
jgi:hypothetical protein